MAIKPSFKQKAAGTLTGMLLIATPLAIAEEGVSLTAYWDSLGKVWTICYGETAGVKFGQKETMESCSFMLALKLKLLGIRVAQMVKTPMSNERWAALTDFSYNLGLGSFKNSTLLKKLNANDLKACDELLRWTYVKGKDCRVKANKCGGIVKRREDERTLCMVK